MITSLNATGNNVDVINFHTVFYLVPQNTVIQCIISANLRIYAAPADDWEKMVLQGIVFVPMLYANWAADMRYLSH